MFFDTIRSLISSVFNIIISSYPEGSLPKSYRIGNRLLRPKYSDSDGIAVAESVLFSHANNFSKLQSLNEHVKFYVKQEQIYSILNMDNTSFQKRRLNADVFYKLDQVESQKTPHSCAHAAKFMVLEYSRSFHKKNSLFSKKSQTNFFLNSYAKSSGYDSGVGFPRIAPTLKIFGLFESNQSRNYGLIKNKGKQWPKKPNELAQYLSYLLFIYGPICLNVKEIQDSFEHNITLTAVFQENSGQPAQVMYADPWEGQMLVNSIDEFMIILFEATKEFHFGQISYKRIPLYYAASFFRRNVGSDHDYSTEGNMEQTIFKY